MWQKEGPMPRDHPGPGPCSSVTLTDSVDELRRVRSWVRSILAGHPTRHVTDTLLLVDELVTDAFTSGQTPHTVRLTPTDKGAQLRIDVDATEHTPPTTTRTPPEHAGRWLLEQLTTDWGVHRHTGTKTTWAILAP